MTSHPIQPASFEVPKGHYSPGYRMNQWLFVSGQLPIRKGAQPDPAMPFDQQVRLVLENVRAVVEAAGGTLASVAKVTAYVTDAALWSEFNRVYAEVFGAHRPARAVVPVPELHFGLQVEVEATAYLGDPSGQRTT